MKVIEFFYLFEDLFKGIFMYSFFQTFLVFLLLLVLIRTFKGLVYSD